MSEQVGKTAPWIEQFLANHPLERLPQEARGLFESFLRHRQGVLDYYRSFPEERIDEKIGEGNSAREDLVDVLATTTTRSRGIREGRLERWEDPVEKADLKRLSVTRLLELLEDSTDDYYRSVEGADLAREIPLPFNKKSTGLGLVQGALTEQSLHLGFAIKFGDKFGTPRPQSVRAIYG